MPALQHVRPPYVATAVYRNAPDAALAQGTAGGLGRAARSKEHPSPGDCLYVGRYRMAHSLAPKHGGSGETVAEDGRGPLKLPQDRAAHYRHHVAQIRSLAAS